MGLDSSPMSTTNRVVASGIVDGGFQEFVRLTRGKYVTFSREGADPFTGSSTLHLNEIRLYETVNLLKD